VLNLRNLLIPNTDRNAGIARIAETRYTAGTRGRSEIEKICVVPTRLGESLPDFVDTKEKLSYMSSNGEFLKEIGPDRGSFRELEHEKWKN